MIESSRAGHYLIRAGKMYRGIKRYRVVEQIVGSNFAILSSGEMRDRKPNYETIGYSFAEGYPYDTIDELNKAIDEAFEMGLKHSSEEDIIQVYNSFKGDNCE